MFYRMSKVMFRELSVTLGTKARPAEEKDVVHYINRSFGLRVEIKGIQIA